MNRIVTVEIGGQSWPMCLTLSAFSKICDRYGSMNDCIKRLDELVKANDSPGLIEEYTWLMDCLLWAARLAEAGDSESNPPVQSELPDLFSPGDMPYIQERVIEAIHVGTARTVGVEAPKNAEGAGEKPAPES